MEIREILAQSQTNCGDGSTMGLRFLIAIGLIEQSRMDDLQDELTNDVALELAYKAIDDALTSLKEHGLVIVPQEPTKKMLYAATPAYRDRLGVPALWQAMIEAEDE